MNLSDKVTIPTQVMARTVGDETVILDLASGTYYGLDPVGARMWQLMTDGQTLAAICDDAAGRVRGDARGAGGRHPAADGRTARQGPGQPGVKRHASTP